MAIIWGRDPGPSPAYSKLDEAIDRGFDPGEDHGAQPTGPITPRIVRWVHQGSAEGCEQCGERCDRCDDRMCSQWGPEPRACGTTCVECSCSCSTCAEAARDREDERQFEIQRDERWA